MTIPDYIISRTIAEERRHRQVRNSPNPDLPEPQPRNRGASDRYATARRRMSGALHAVARQIDPQPATND